MLEKLITSVTNPVEWIGLVGSVFVFISFLYNDPIRIRIINSIGTVLFIVYGILFGALSVILLDTSILVLQIVQIKRGKNRRKHE